MVVISESVDIPPQNPHTGRMKSRYPYLFGTKPDQLIHTLPHLSGRLIGKRDRHNMIRLYALLFHKIGNPVRQSTRLAASGSRQHEHGPRRCKNRFLLFLV